MNLETFKKQLAEFYYTDMPCEYEFYFNPKFHLSIGLVDNYANIRIVSEIQTLIPNIRIFGGCVEDLNIESLEPFGLGFSTLKKKNTDGFNILTAVKENFHQLKDVEDIKLIHNTLKTASTNPLHQANTYVRTYQFPNMVCKNTKDFSCPATIRVNFHSYSREDVELVYCCGTDKLEAEVKILKVEGEFTLKEIIETLATKGTTGKYRSSPHDTIVRDVLGLEMRKYFIDEILENLNS